MRTARFALFPVLLALAACGGERIGAPAGLDGVNGGSNGVIWDGSREGNPEFFFLPPLLPNPSGDDEFDAGAFNGNWKPVVRICRLTTAAPIQCESENGAPAYLATYQGSAVTVSLADEHYAVNVNTRDEWATTGTYRVHVFLPRVEPLLVGYADIVLVSSQQAFRSVNSSELVPLMDGRTLPLKFRIEDGVAVHGSSDFVEVLVTDAGGTFVTNTGDAGIAIESGWLPDGLDQVMLTITRSTPGANNDCHFGGLPSWVRQYEGCYQIETSPAVGIIQADAVVGLCTEAPSVVGQVMYKSDPAPGGRRVKALPNAPMPPSLSTALTCGGFTGLASAGPAGFGDMLRSGAMRLASALGRAISPRPLYAIDFGEGGHLRRFADDLSSFGWAVPAHVHATAGDGQSGAPGALLLDTLKVRVTATHAHNATTPDPIAGVPVTFSVTAGGGSLVVLDAVTDANGYARAFWTLGALGGTQTVTATIADDSTNNAVEFPPERTVTFTANAVAAPLVSIFQGDTDITGATLEVDTDYSDNLTVSTTGPGPCFLSTSAPSVVNVDGTLVVANGPGTAVITAACGATTVYGTATVTYVVTEATTSGVDSIRVTYYTDNAVGPANTATIFYGFTGPTPTTFTMQPWMGGTVHPSPSCSYVLTNPPAPAAIMSITGSTPTTVTLTTSTSSPADQPSQLQVTCNGLVRTIAVTSQAIPG